MELSFLPDEFSRTEKEYAYMFLEAESDWIEEQYENEFELHFFQSDGQEVSLHDINQLVGGQITDFDKVEKTKPYTASFADVMYRIKQEPRNAVNWAFLGSFVLLKIGKPIHIQIVSFFYNMRLIHLHSSSYVSKNFF